MATAECICAELRCRRNLGRSEETKTVKRLIDALRQMRRDGLIDSEAFDETETVPEPTITALAASGWLGLTIPREFGGVGLSPAAYARVFGEVSRMDASLAVLIGVHCGLARRPSCSSARRRRNNAICRCSRAARPWLPMR